MSLNAVRRAEKDRISAGAGYYYGREEDRDTGDKDTTVDYWFALAKYDYFLTKQLYLFGGIRVERDRIADLDLRVTPRRRSWLPVVRDPHLQPFHRGRPGLGLRRLPEPGQ
jgi:hypothetical protein